MENIVKFKFSSEVFKVVANIRPLQYFKWCLEQFIGHQLQFGNIWSEPYSALSYPYSSYYTLSLF